MYKFSKRILDIIIATIALVVLSPLFLFCIIVLLFTGEHEVFYRQKRIGYKNRPFGIWKFATMVKDSPNIGTGAITLRNDPRVTRFGKFLRISKINELPQIINVITGQMSIVGPRPLMGVSVALYPDAIRDKIYNAKPGMTGIGSLIFRDEEKLFLKHPTRMRCMPVSILIKGHWKYGTNKMPLYHRFFDNFPNSLDHPLSQKSTSRESF
jgi:lipopolysaccharide/colanic/teichoic acid biosynthesis glycosyltransferase